METPYACYLQLPDLLDLQQPRTPDEHSTQWTDEHFFLIVHQSAEILAGQALVDLRLAAHHARRSRQSTAVTALHRVTAVMEALESHLALLDHLTPESFATLRPLVDNVSGAQSSQFAALFQQIAATRAGCDGQGAASEAAQQEVAEALRALRAAVTRWRTRHLLLVERMIGDQPGTGGTSGLAYLRSQIDLPPRVEGQS